MKVYRLNVLLATEKDEIIEKSLAYLNSHRTFFSQGPLLALLPPSPFFFGRAWPLRWAKGKLGGPRRALLQATT